MENKLITIAITGEGSTDYGKRDYKTNKWLWGPVANYIINIANEHGINIELIPIEREDVQKIKLQRSVKGLDGKGVPARKFAGLAKEAGCEYGIYYCDADKESSSHNNAVQAKKKFEEVHSDICRGVDISGIYAIPMVPLRMIESWLLGDKKALEKYFAVNIDNKHFPQEPELLWGNKVDNDSNYPKNVLNRVIRQSDNKYKDYQNNREDFCEIANLSDTDTLKQTCKISYSTFYDEFVCLLNSEK